jgi:hypothetical protein
VVRILSSRIIHQMQPRLQRRIPRSATVW